MKSKETQLEDEKYLLHQTTLLLKDIADYILNTKEQYKDKEKLLEILKQDLREHY